MEKTFATLIQEFKDYRPANKVTTSSEEVEKIKSHFSLEHRSVFDLRNLRDMVVLMYQNWMRETIAEESSKFMVAMQSIVSVIDYVTMAKY